jgi:Uma2 family endonuclease
MTIQLLDKIQPLVEVADPQHDTLTLVAGDYLTRPEFERRYHAHPEIKKAELIEGIVYMPSPVRADRHGDPHFIVITWLGNYQVATPGVRGSDNATLRLDFLNEPQPDVILQLDPAVGGHSYVDADGYLQGAPELIVEVAASSVSYDMHQKKNVYARHGVIEYLVLLPMEQQIAWFVLRDGHYERLRPDRDGILRSQVFPGLWLQPIALLENDLATLLALLQQGLASSEHAAFVSQLKGEAQTSDSYPG